MRTGASALLCQAPAAEAADNHRPLLDWSSLFIFETVLTLVGDVIVDVPAVVEEVGEWGLAPDRTAVRVLDQVVVLALLGVLALIMDPLQHGKVSGAVLRLSIRVCGLAGDGPSCAFR